MTRFLLDQGLPRSAVNYLRDAGWDIVHTYDIGLSRAPDSQILDYARHEERVCVTLDADFHALLAVSNADSPSVIRIRQEGLRGLQLAELLLQIRPQVEQHLAQGAMVTVDYKSVRIRHLPINAIKGNHKK